MDTAQAAGTTALLLVGVTAGFGGQALAKSLFGDKASDYTVSGLKILAKKVTDGAKVSVKEGVTEFVEEALPQLIVATVNSQMDPSYDVAGSVWENGFLGAIAGTGVAASLYSGDQVADAAVRLNAGVKTALSTAKNATEATAALKKLGFTDNVVLNNMLNSTYDTMYVSTNEAAEIFATVSPEFTPTAAQIASFVKPGSSADVTKQISAFVGSRQVTSAEVRQMYKDLGYTPTDAEVAARVGQGDVGFQDNVKTTIGNYVNPRQTTAAEVRQMYKNLGYTPTDAEVNARVGQGDAGFQANVKTTAGQYVNPRQTTTAEVKQMFKDLGYTPTDAEVAARVGQGGAGFQANTKTTAGKYVEPRMVDAKEVTDAYAALGLQRPTEADINSLVGQYMETDLAGKAKTNLATARYNSILDIIGSVAGDAGVSDELQASLDLVKNDMIAALGDLGLDVAVIDRAVTGIKDAVDALPVGASPEDVSAAISDAISGLENISAADVSNAITTALAGRNDLSPEDVQGIVDGAFGTVGESIADLETKLTKLIADNDGDVDAALLQLTKDLGTTESALLKELGTTKSALSEQFTADIGSLETKLTKLIADNDGDVDAALLQLTKDLGTTETALLKELGTTKSALTKSIGGVRDDVSELSDVVGAPGTADDPNTAANEATDPTGLFATMQMYEDAGLSRDDALNAAIGDVSTALGIARADLLAAVEETETTLSGQISDVESTLGGQISDVEANLGADIQTVADFVGKPARNVTQTDIDFVIDLIAQGNISQELTSQYDVTGDGLIDINDQTTLESYLQGTPDVALDPNSIFNPATGLYLQQEIDTQATQDLNTDLNTQTNKNINTQTQNILTQLEEGQRKENIKDMYQMIEQSGDAYGQRVDVKTPEPGNLNYIYDFSSIFANPSQEGLFARPFGGPARGRAQPGIGAPSLTPQFSAGGQVEDETDMLLRLLGDM